MECRCERCRPDNPDPKLTEEHKWACLARFVNALPTVEERRGFLSRWRERHGRELTERLKAEMTRLWRS